MTHPTSGGRAGNQTGNRFTLGTLDITRLDDGTFRLDGGAMFGVVPKVLWQKQKPADERNRIQMATNSLLIRRGDHRLLVDTGIGDKNDARFRDLFGMEEGATRLPEQLAAAGCAPEEITHVLLTHLHFDHCGWNTRLLDGELVPTFPNARYFIARRELEHARAPNARDRASYDPRNWEPLFEAGLVEVFDETVEPIPGVHAMRAPGHNEGMCIVLLDGGEDERGVFWADLVPTTAHVPYAWIMGFDLYPLETLANKELWLPRAFDEGWLCIFQHEAETPIGRLVEDKPGRYRAEPLNP